MHIQTAATQRPHRLGVSPDRASQDDTVLKVALIAGPAGPSLGEPRSWSGAVKRQGFS